MSTAPYPKLKLSLQWANPKAQAAHRALLPRHAVARTIRHALKLGAQGLPLKVQEAEIVVRIVGEGEARALNHQYRAKDYATNVLTFDYAIAPVLWTDLVLCAPVVEREAHEQLKPLKAHYSHLLVHGALHALGYDHEQSQIDAAKMEALEILILKGLGYDNPY